MNDAFFLYILRFNKENIFIINISINKYYIQKRLGTGVLSVIN